MTSPTDVAAFHHTYDRHQGDRVRLFAALRELVPATAPVLYPGSYVDIAPSVWFDHVTYVDVDARASRFFGEEAEVTDLILAERDEAGAPADGPDPPTAVFHHLDYRNELPVARSSIGLLVSLYAGFISEHCTGYLRPGGLILANDSHGDASMASLDPDNDLVAVVKGRNGRYKLVTTELDTYLEPKRGRPPTRDELHTINRGIASTRPAAAYVFQRR